MSSNVVLKLMNIINGLQLMQAICHFLSGPMIVFPKLHERIHLAIGVIGTLLNIGWVGEFPIITILAFCRILIFNNTITLKKMPVVVELMLVLLGGWAIFLFFFGSYFQYVILDPPNWGFNYSLPVMKFVDAQELTISFTCLSLTYLAYMFMAYLIFKKKNMSSCVQSRKSEMMILIQSTFVICYLTVLITIWHQPMLGIQLVDMSLRRNRAIVNGVVVIHCYINPILTLVCNRAVREQCTKYLKVHQVKSGNSANCLAGTKASVSFSPS
ncbi:hypothetical protein L5515_006122 [Caenorhabditis briggsae]|uniref:Uncharacterized protein n=1 Tax=Caenorhabditis briggsae TaxID=6238 RepID=A0AAE9JID2_CAEBR|nr:hypothetical protein L5515_006122 [Caenorhabditis briggsae]